MQAAKDYIKYVREIREISKEIFGNKLKHVYVLGSIVRGKTHSMGDIDVAVFLSKDAEEEMRQSFGFAHPFKIHVLNFDEWKLYERFVKDDFIEA